MLTTRRRIERSRQFVEQAGVEYERNGLVLFMNREQPLECVKKWVGRFKSRPDSKEFTARLLLAVVANPDATIPETLFLDHPRIRAFRDEFHGLLASVAGDARVLRSHLAGMLVDAILARGDTNNPGFRTAVHHLLPRIHALGHSMRALADHHHTVHAPMLAGIKGGG